MKLTVPDLYYPTTKCLSWTRAWAKTLKKLFFLLCLWCLRPLCHLLWLSMTWISCESDNGKIEIVLTPVQESAQYKLAYFKIENKYFINQMTSPWISSENFLPGSQWLGWELSDHRARAKRRGGTGQVTTILHLQHLMATLLQLHLLKFKHPTTQLASSYLSIFL